MLIVKSKITNILSRQIKMVFKSTFPWFVLELHVESRSIGRQYSQIGWADKRCKWKTSYSVRRWSHKHQVLFVRSWSGRIGMAWSKSSNWFVQMNAWITVLIGRKESNKRIFNAVVNFNWNVDCEMFKTHFFNKILISIWFQTIWVPLSFIRYCFSVELT